MWSVCRKWRRRRVLASADTSPEGWAQAWGRLPSLKGLDAGAARRLRELATLFLAEKALEPTGDLRIEPWMARELALQASLPVLSLGPDWHAGWVSVVIYPDTFISEFESQDEAGVIHHIREARSGESWERGPLILSWADVEAGREADGYNVVIHEIAHKLDALNGALNGMPPLHRDMSPAAWSGAFGQAFADLERRVIAGENTVVDPYACESPAEFFAVVSESFFEVPDLLVDAYPEVYAQLRLFYRQDPLRRRPPVG